MNWFLEHFCGLAAALLWSYSFYIVYVVLGFLLNAIEMQKNLLFIPHLTRRFSHCLYSSRLGPLLFSL